MLKIITFANNNYIRPRKLLVSKIKDMNFECSLISYGKKDLDSEFREKHKSLLSLKRGYGYWIWKPYLILKTLLQSNENDIIIYIDSTDVPSPIFFDSVITHFENNDILLINTGHLHDEYTKRDCFILMNCDDEKYHNQIQLEAGILAVRKTEFNIKLLREWLKYCSNIFVVTDLPNSKGFPNYKGFKEHRHDQSILTNLSIKYNIPSIYINNIELVEFNKLKGRMNIIALLIFKIKLNLANLYDFLKNPEKLRKKTNILFKKDC